MKALDDLAARFTCSCGQPLRFVDVVCEKRPSPHQHAVCDRCHPLVTGCLHGNVEPVGAKKYDFEATVQLYEKGYDELRALLGDAAKPEPPMMVVDGKEIGRIVDVRADGEDGVRFTVEPTPAVRAEMMIVELGDAANKWVAFYALQGLAKLFELEG